MNILSYVSYNTLIKLALWTHQGKKCLERNILLAVYSKCTYSNITACPGTVEKYEWPVVDEQHYAWSSIIETVFIIIF